MNNKLSATEKVNFGIGSIAYSFPYTILGGAFLLYATVILKIPPLYASIVVAISALWDGVSDPLMGYISDKTKSVFFGRRHLYILLGSFLTAAFTWLFWSISPEQTLSTKIILLTVYILLLKTAMTIFVIPYNALGGELSTEYDERSSVQSWRAAFYILGMLLSIFLSNLIFFKPTEEFTRGQLNPSAYPEMGYYFAIIILVVGLFTYFTTRRHIPSLPKPGNNQQSIKGFLQNLKSCLKNSNMRNLALMIFTIEVGFQITVSNSFLINTFSYNLAAIDMAILGITLLGSSILSQPFWVKFTKKYDKKPALVVSGVIGIVGFGFAPWIIVWWEIIPISSPLLMWTLGFFSVLAGISNGAFMSIPFSMISDAADEAEQETGSNDSGMFFGIYTFAYKAGISVSLLISGIILDVIGFDEKLSVQSESTSYYLALTPSWLLVLILPLAFYFISQYKIKRESVKQPSVDGSETIVHKLDQKDSKHSTLSDNDIESLGLQKP